MTVQQDIQQMSADLRAFTQEMRKYANAQSAITKETYVYSDAIEGANDNLAKLEKRLEKQGKVSDELHRAQQRQLRAERDKAKLIEEYEKQKTALEDLRNSYRENGKRMTDEEKAAHKQQRKSGFDRLREIKANQKRVDAELSSVGDVIGKAGRGMAGRINFVAGILATLGKSFVEYSGRFMDASAASSGVIEERTASFDEGMSYWINAMAATGVESQKALEIMASNRQMVNALGGMSNTIKTAEDSVHSMLGFYGSQEEALRSTTNIMTQFANKGVKPNTATLARYNKDLTMLAEQTGMSATALNGMIDSIANDTSSLSILKAAREDEREAILANQRALLKSNVALGMTAEQAAEAGKMLNKMVTQKPLERLKQAAKMRAMGAAMGLGPESELAAQAVTAGKRATAQQKQDLNDFSVKMAGMADQSAQGGLGQEIFTSVLLDKLDMDQYFGQDSPFSTTLGTVLAKSQNDVAEIYKSSSDSIIKEFSYYSNIAGQIWEHMKNGDVLWQMLIGGVYNIKDGLVWLGDKFWEVSKWVGGLIISGFESLVDGVKYLWDLLSDFTGGLIADFKDFMAAMHNLGEYIKHPLDEGARDIRPMDNVEKHDLMVARRKQDEEHEKQILIQKEQQAKEQQSTQQTAKEKEKSPELDVARPVTPGEKPTVNVAPNPAQESVEKTRSDKVDEVLTDQFLATVDQTNKIESQLKQMVQSNEYLKILAETNPKLVDIAEKQLAVSTMTQEQRDRAASRMRSENSKFNADYGYAV